MSKHTTRKAGDKGKALTLHRKAQRRAKLHVHELVLAGARA